MINEAGAFSFAEGILGLHRGRAMLENPAHAEIHSSPAYKNKGAFKELLEQLAWLAKWEICPADTRKAKS